VFHRKFTNKPLKKITWLRFGKAKALSKTEALGFKAKAKNFGLKAKA